MSFPTVLQKSVNKSCNFRVEPPVPLSAPPQIRTSAINASGSSNHGFTAYTLKKSSFRHSEAETRAQSKAFQRYPWIFGAPLDTGLRRNDEKNPNLEVYPIITTVCPKTPPSGMGWGREHQSFRSGYIQKEFKIIGMVLTKVEPDSKKY